MTTAAVNRFTGAGQLIAGTTFRVGQLVVYMGSVVVLRKELLAVGRIIGAKRKLIVVDFGALGEFECRPDHLLAAEETDTPHP